MPFEIRGVSELATTLGILPAEVRKALRPGVLAAARLIADQVEVNAGWSSYIPGAVSTGARFSASGGGAVIKVAERDFPHLGEVRVLEGDGVHPTPFRHPVFDSDREVWTSKNAMTRPFAGPAVLEKRDEAEAVIAEAVMAVIAAAGLS